ncbi:MAG: leucine--tRNA ligase [Gemmatimonadetes bacterium]|nr:leucine--tRNA ligase [Gemmatimonadota bacterium]
MASEVKDGYDPSAVEAKWQRLWDERGTNRFTLEQLRAAKDPYYNLMMFPYPSAEGLHVGNIYAFTGADVHGRYHRLRGKTVFEPMGFDAFGIHSENFALKVGKHPMDLIPSNVANFTRQLKRIGGMFDWNHAVDTTDPDYYKWTQWVFVQLFEAGLAERKEAPVNWCPSCMTVLANEQVIAGECERCGTAVEQRRIAQWFFKITKYAERLLDNLARIDWSEKTKKAQVNWLGRSEGARLRFPVVDEKGRETGTTIEVYTTRPDTVFGATYMVLSPEHPLVDKVTNPGLSPPVYAYRDKARQKDLVARQKVDKTKTGVSTGGYVRNPATGQSIPIWIADYVLMGYGTGAIMAVPGHDQRDFDFAQQFELPIVRVVAGPGADATTSLDEAYVGPGVLVNSGRFDGTDVTDSVRVLTRWAAEQGWGEGQVNYRLHDWCISRQRYWGPPIPIIYCDACGPVAVPADQLPVVLPRVEDFQPDDSGVSPLARVESWYRTTCPKCGKPARRETDVSDTFLDSGWYFLRYPSTDFRDRPFDAAITKKWLPVDSYIGGHEHAVLHLLYSRFVTMALHDLGHLDFEEPYDVFRAHGLIISEGAKMSKSKGNVIVPDPVIEEYGADTLRTYLMFLGPFEEGGDYRQEGIQGPYGFLHRLWDTVVSAGEGTADAAVERKVHQTIRQVTEQIPSLQYNTAIAALMECLNVVRAGGRAYVRAEVEPLVPLLAPFAPHIAEELWERLGHRGSIFDGANWPAYDPAKAAETSVTIAVQVNGKLRGSISVAKGAAEAAVVAAARADENVARHLEGVQEKKVIYVKERLVNFVVVA